MKKIFLFAVTLFLVSVCVAQSKNKKETVKVDFYGIDFSQVKVVGAAETEDQFITAFANINQLLISEQSKYDVGKFLKFDVQSLDIDHAISQVDKLKGVKFKNSKKPEVSLKDIIESYPVKQGNILLIVAKELNKGTNTGTFVAVVFDGEKKEIISEQQFSGKARGFGLRNFWAGALYNGLKSVR